MNIASINTPAALIDQERMQHNISRMQKQMHQLGVSFRPHVKTSKCLQVVQAQCTAGAKGITVSTLKEAIQFFQGGITDILYAVGITANKLRQAEDLLRQGCDLKIITDNSESARAIVKYAQKTGIAFKVLIEIDTDGHRSGVLPASPDLLPIAAILAEGPCTLEGVLTHAGSSYDLHEPEAIRALAEQERAGCVLAAERLRTAGYPCPVVSVGSTPTALSATSLEGVTEVRAGVYVFFDLVMHSVGVCTMDEIALSVLSTVIGHQTEKGWAIVDAGWMAMSRDRGTAGRALDYGYGQICDIHGKPIEGYIVSGANQEHGIVSCTGEPDKHIAERFPIGTMLRILPNHACATGAQFPEYHLLSGEDELSLWPRFYGW